MGFGGTARKRKGPCTRQCAWRKHGSSDARLAEACPLKVRNTKIQRRRDAPKMAILEAPCAQNAPGRSTMHPPEALLPRNPTWESPHFSGLTIHRPALSGGMDWWRMEWPFSRVRKIFFRGRDSQENRGISAERAIFAKFQAPKFENSEPEKMQFHTPSHSIPPLDSLLIQGVGGQKYRSSTCVVAGPAYYFAAGGNTVTKDYEWIRRVCCCCPECTKIARFSAVAAAIFTLRAKGALISEPRFSTPCEMRFFPREKEKTAFFEKSFL